MQADGDIFLDAVVEGGGLPVVEEEDHGHGLAEVVELQARGADGGEDAGVRDGARGDGEFAGAQDEVGVCCCSAASSACGVGIEGNGRRGAYPNGSPTTRNATSPLSASLSISSLDDSTISRSAMMTSRP